MMFADTYVDIFTAMCGTFIGDDKAKQAKCKEKFPGIAAKVMCMFECCLPAKGYLHGRCEPSLADIAIYSIITFPEHGL